MLWPKIEDDLYNADNQNEDHLEIKTTLNKYSNVAGFQSFNVEKVTRSNMHWFQNKKGMKNCA